MKQLRYLGILVLPLFLIVAGEVLTKFTVVKIKLELVRSSMYASIGILISIGIYFILKYLFQALNLNPISLGRFSLFFVGLIIGAIVCLVSGIGYGYLNGYEMKVANLFTNLPMRTIANIYPSLTEEFFFRGGIVEIIGQIFGRIWGLAAGSIPFGVLHVIGKLFGKTVTISQIFGITLAGLMLSLVYLKFGIWSSIGCHLAWNSLVGGWAQVYGIDNKEVTTSIEGSWITCVVLIGVILFLICSLKPTTSS